MAKLQTRRAVSLNREVYVSASSFAFRSGKTLSQLTTDAYRAYGIPIPDTHHMPLEVAELAAEAIRHGIPRREEKRDRRKRSRIGAFAKARIVDSFLRVQRPGPIRKALGDAHADVCGEPYWFEKVSARSIRIPAETAP